MGIGGADPRRGGDAGRARSRRVRCRQSYPGLVGGGTPFFAALDDWVDLDLVETRAFPGGVHLTRYETRS